MDRDLRTLPKAHLHLHLEGSARPETVAELAARNGVVLDDLRSFASKADLLERYAVAVSAVSKGEDLERLCYELLVDEAAQGVRWCEPHVEPQRYAPALGSLDEVWGHMREGFRRAADKVHVGWGVIIGHDRALPAEQAEAMATWAAEHRGDGVVGFGLTGDEQAAGPTAFARACAIAAEAGLLVVPHAGETAGAESVAGALGLGAHRLAHGVRALEDRELLARLADEEVTCDVCPTANLRLAIVAHLDEHPLPALLDAGVPVTLGSDHPLFFGSGVADEYQVARTAWGLSDTELAEIARTSALASGAPKSTRAGILSAIDDWTVS